MKRLIIFIILAALIYPSQLSFKDIPIQEEGRIKPLDTFSKNQLLRISGKRSISGLSSSEWLFGVLTDNSEILSIPVFNIRNPEVVQGLELDGRKSHKYTFREISNSINLKFEMLEKIHRKPEEHRTLVEEQLLEIFFNATHFKKLKSGLLCVAPIIPMYNPIIADRVGSSVGEKVSFFQIVQNMNSMVDLVDSIKSKNIENWSSADSSFYNILIILENMHVEKSSAFKIIPSINGGEWLSPWGLINSGQLEGDYNDLLVSLESYVKSNYNKDDLGMEQAMQSYEKSLYEISDSVPSISILEKETWYNKANLFVMSMVFYIIAFLVICTSLLFWPNILKKIALVSTGVGIGLHAYGLYLRMVIMGRPPVTTLYESILFVSFIAVLCALIIEYFRKDGLGVLIAALCGIIFHYMSFGYAADGDTLGMLVAVLNSNFWLATHVTTITIGYGTSIVAGLIGHIYLLYAIIYPKRKKKLKSIYNNMFGVTILALFFTLFGTILGGIWADQSWGRFWGWDPKENGALLICMWQIFMIHLRLTDMVKSAGFAFGMIINNIIVIMAWFGVNLLSIGLHSYGFVSGIAVNLVIFTSFELVVGSVGYYWAKKNRLKASLL